MKRLLNWIVISLIIIVGWVGYIAGMRNGLALTSLTSTDKLSSLEMPKQISDLSSCPRMSAGVYKKYLGTQEAMFIGLPEFIALQSETSINNRTKANKLNDFKTREKEIEKMITLEGEGDDPADATLGISKPILIDVDGDNKDEEIYYVDLYMNHRPHMVMVVRNGKVVFEAEGGSIGIEKVGGMRGGFFLEQEVDRTMGEYKKTRYVPQGDGFMPIWTQKICYVQFD